jgi:hypothetical protein
MKLFIRYHMREWEFIIINDQESRLNVIDKISKNTKKADAVRIIDILY